jgi:hypothetical protein
LAQTIQKAICANFLGLASLELARLHVEKMRMRELNKNTEPKDGAVVALIKNQLLSFNSNRSIVSISSTKTNKQTCLAVAKEEKDWARAVPSVIARSFVTTSRALPSRPFAVWLVVVVSSASPVSSMRRLAAF